MPTRFQEPRLGYVKVPRIEEALDSTYIVVIKSNLYFKTSFVVINNTSNANTL